MSRLTLILGGARSGKSDFAEELAKSGGRVAFIATAKPLDLEMEERIEKHRRSRPKNWATFEVDVDLSACLKGAECDVAILDCLTIFVANCMEAAKAAALDPESFTIEGLKEGLKAARESGAEFIVVSNEVGSGIVPENELARNYRDILGKANQLLAGRADSVYLMVAGIPVKIKD
ncbi:MAG: bifunctional adenosylcobinamide kinase/adenosylcobinamide-phosphate guanylyltransferase [Actinomycetota bacterium]|nr:bifunctional adenosylcobinamide kinase/adenosylcobinamide-phosphate guanylyltransferase [Actinomycetota bacterium]